MPVSEIDRAKQLLEQEKHLGAAERMALWRGRYVAAVAWSNECFSQYLNAKLGISQLEVDVVVEATAPPEGGA